MSNIQTRTNLTCFVLTFGPAVVEPGLPVVVTCCFKLERLVVMIWAASNGVGGLLKWRWRAPVVVTCCFKLERLVVMIWAGASNGVGGLLISAAGLVLVKCGLTAISGKGESALLRPPMNLFELENTCGMRYGPLKRVVEPRELVLIGSW